MKVYSIAYSKLTTGSENSFEISINSIRGENQGTGRLKAFEKNEVLRCTMKPIHSPTTPLRN